MMPKAATLWQGYQTWSIFRPVRPSVLGTSRPATTNAENPTNTWHVNFNNGPREHQQEEWMAGTMGESEWSFPDVILCWCDVSACFKKDIFS
jgi:hypothetical protein